MTRSGHIALLIAVAVGSSVAAKDAEILATIATGGGNVSWSPDRGLLAFDTKGDSDYYSIRVMKTDGSGAQSFPRSASSLPGKNVGQPLWTRDGKYLIFQTEKAKHPYTVFGFVAHPTAGVFNDLWIAPYPDGRPTLLREVSAGKDHGAVRPSLPPDGKTLVWSEMYERPRQLGNGKEVGYWRLMKGDLDTTGKAPRLTNVVRLRSEGEGFHEACGWSPDGKQMLFGSNFGRKTAAVFRSMDSCIYDFPSKKIKRLTSDGYNQHARFTPDVKWVVYARSKGAGKEGMDLWAMRPDGSEKRQITFFSVPGYKHYVGKTNVIADFDWLPDGESIVAHCFDTSKGPIKQNERVIVVRVSAELP